MAVVFFLAVLLLITLALYHNQYWRRRGVNGPTSWPFVGSMLSVINPLDPPMKVINNWTKKYGTIFGYQHGWKNVLVVANAEMAYEILVTKFDCFIERRISPNMNHKHNSTASISLFAAGEKRWRRLRSITNPVFSASNLKQLFPIIDNSAKETVKFLFKAADESEPIDIIKYSREYSMDIIAQLALGQSSSEQFQNKLVQTAVGVFASFGSSIFCHLSWMFPVLGGLFGRVGMFLEALGCFAFVKLLLTVRRHVEERKRIIQQGLDKIDDQKQDFINLFLRAESLEPIDNALNLKKHMTIDEVVSQCTVILLAGFETTSNTLTLLFYYLALYQDEQEALRREIDCVRQYDLIKPNYEQLNRLKHMHAFINEVLRLNPVGAFAVSRICTVETVINSLKIEVDTHIQLDSLALNTDPVIWGSDATQFKPERWLNRQNNHPLATHYSFGLGKRSCIGKELAFIELKIILSHVLQHFCVLPASIPMKPVKFQGLTTLSPTNVEICLERLNK